MAQIYMMVVHWLPLLLTCISVSASSHRGRTAEPTREQQGRSPSPIEVQFAPLPQHFGYGLPPTVEQGHRGVNALHNSTDSMPTVAIQIPYAIPISPAVPLPSAGSSSGRAPHQSYNQFPVFSTGKRTPATDAHLQEQDMMRALQRPAKNSDEYFEGGNTIVVPPQQGQMGTHFRPAPRGQFGKASNPSPQSPSISGIARSSQSSAERNRQDKVKSTEPTQIAPRHVDEDKYAQLKLRLSSAFFRDGDHTINIRHVPLDYERLHRFTQELHERPKRGRPKGSRAPRTRTPLVELADARLREKRREILHGIHAKNRAKFEQENRYYLEKIVQEAENAVTDAYMDERTRFKLLQLKGMEGEDRRKAISRLVSTRKYRDKKREQRIEDKLKALELAGYPHDEARKLAKATSTRSVLPAETEADTILGT